MPSYGGAHGPDGSNKTGDQGQGTRDKGGGQTGGGKSGGGGGKGSGRVGMGSFGGLPGQPTRDMFQRQDQIGAKVAAAQRDYNNEGAGFFDRVGNFLASGFGFNEMNPTAPGYSQPGMPGVTGKANWGFDPAGLVGGLAGSAFGIPMTGFLTDKISSMFGRPLEINMGANVFGGSAPSFGTASKGYSPFGGTGNNNSQYASKPPMFSQQSQQPQQPSAPATSSLPNTPKFPGFPDYKSYSPFSGSSWSWG